MNQWTAVDTCITTKFRLFRLKRLNRQSSFSANLMLDSWSNSFEPGFREIIRSQSKECTPADPCPSLDSFEGGSIGI